MSAAEFEELEIRIEARFVLWALRCCARHRAGAAPTAAGEVLDGFELADVAATLDRFWRFAQALCEAVASPDVWHHPTCECLSVEERRILEALCFAAIDEPGPARSLQAWSALVDAESAEPLHELARHWLHALARAGVCYPLPGELVREGSFREYAGLPVPPQRH